MRRNFYRVLLLLTFMWVSSVSAFAWSWDDCVSWFRVSGKSYLAGYAHPTYDIDDCVFTISETTPDIVVLVRYVGHVADFSCRYRVVRGYRDGIYYFKNIEVIREGNFWANSFSLWSDSPGLYGSFYDRFRFKYLYDQSNFSNLSRSRKAAAALMMEFITTQ